MSPRLKVLLAKASRIARAYPRVYCTEFLAPLWNRDQLLAFILAAVGSYLVYRDGALPEVLEEMGDWALKGEAFGWMLIIWALIMAVRTPFVIVANDRRAAVWRGHNRIYKEPRLVATERFVAGNGEPEVVNIRFDDAEPNAMVYYTYDLDPQVYDRVGVCLVTMGMPDDVLAVGAPARQGPKHYNGIRLSTDKEVRLWVQMDPETRPVICRIYCHSYHIGKDELNA